MGRKSPTKEPESEVKSEQKNEEDETDSPVVIKLKEIDDKYLELEREYEKELDELIFRFQKQQQPLLDKRREKLMEGTDQTSGTPACPSFWRKAMQNHPAFQELIETHDVPVLEYLTDITTQFLDETDTKKGFRLTFQFAENPYFSNSTLVKAFQVKEVSPYTQEQEAVEIIGSDIDWKTGKNVTVTTVAKKPKGGGAKKAKQKGKTTEEPRDSFFRSFFRSYKPGMELPDDLNLDDARELCDDEDDDEQMLSLIMENELEIGTAVRDQLIPFAVRWYTGEAAPDMDDDEESESEDGEDDDDDDDDDDSPKTKKDVAKKKGGGAAAGAEDQKQECKQQ